MNEVQPPSERKLSKHNRYYQRNQDKRKAKALAYYHNKGKEQRQMRKEAAMECEVPGRDQTNASDDAADDAAACTNGDASDSDSNWSDGVDDESDGGSSEGWYDSDASVEGGLLSVDTTFLRRYQSEHWLRDEDDTVGYRIQCLGEDLELWLSRWGGVSNWEVIAANPARGVQIREQMELGIQYAELMRRVWGAKAQGNFVQSKEVKLYWEHTAKLMSRLYDALSMLGAHMDWEYE